MQFYEVKICEVMIFRLFTVYNKHNIMKIGNQTREGTIASAPIIFQPTVNEWGPVMWKIFSENLHQKAHFSKTNRTFRFICSVFVLGFL